MDLKLKAFKQVRAFLTGLLIVMATAAPADTSAQLQGVTVKQASDQEQVIQFDFSHALKQIPAYFKTLSPSRLVMDFPNTIATLDKNKYPLPEGLFSGVKLVEGMGRLRAVVDLKEPIEEQIELKGQQLVVYVKGKMDSVPGISDALAAGDAPQAKSAAQMTATAVSGDSGPLFHNQATDIQFHRADQTTGQVSITLNNPNIASEIKERDGALLIVLLNTQVTQRLQKTLDVKDFATPTQTLTTSQVGPHAHILLKNTGNYDYYAYQVGKRFVVDIMPIAKGQKPLREMSRKVRYHGERITLNFQDIKIRAVLQLLSEFTGINMVASDSIQGSITLRLRQVPWDEALDIILKTQGLAKRQIGNVMLIAPIDEMASREKQELQATQEVADLSPVVSELITVNYANAADVAGLIKDKNNSLLSSRGHISTDTRTNTLWVQDTQEKIVEIKKVLERLDRPVRQVLIEARIVNVNLDYEKDLGIRFGVTKKNFLSGDLEGANALRQGVAPQNIPIPDRLNMDFRAAPVVGNPATVAVALARIGSGYLLDLELSALESEGHGNIISSPRLITADQQTAKIESGEEIPYQESTSSGATSVSFKKAVLSLQVTPHITPDNKLILTLEVHQDTRGTETVNGVPSINTRQIQTNVLVDNGETIVLGGIYEQTTTNSVERIPFLGDLPLVGRLFRNNQDINKHSELLIFVTPKIVENNLA